MASADFGSPIATPCDATSLSAEEPISRGKTRDLRSIHPPHLRPLDPNDIGLQVFWPSRPPSVRLLCGSCSSGRSFAYSFLQTNTSRSRPCCSA